MGRDPPTHAASRGSAGNHPSNLAQGRHSGLSNLLVLLEDNAIFRLGAFSNNKPIQA